MKFNVRVRIIDPHKRATHEDQVYEAETGLDAMKAAQADEKNTDRGLVQCNGCDPLPLDDGQPATAAKNEVEPEAPLPALEAGAVIDPPKNKGGRPKKVRPDDAAPGNGEPPKTQTTPVP